MEAGIIGEIGVSIPDVKITFELELVWASFSVPKRSLLPPAPEPTAAGVMIYTEVSIPSVTIPLELVLV